MCVKGCDGGVWRVICFKRKLVLLNTSAAPTLMGSALFLHYHTDFGCQSCLVKTARNLQCFVILRLDVCDVSLRVAGSTKVFAYLVPC